MLYLDLYTIIKQGEWGGKGRGVEEGGRGGVSQQIFIQEMLQ